MTRTVERWIVVGLGGGVVTIGVLVAGLLAWGLSGGLSPATSTADPVWETVVLPLPDGLGRVALRRDASHMADGARQVLVEPVQGDVRRLPLWDLGSPSATVDVWLVPWPDRDGAALWLEDPPSALRIDLNTGRTQRLWRQEDRRWLVDVVSPEGSAPTEGGLPVAEGRAVALDGDWPPPSRIRLGRVVEVEGIWRFEPVR